MKNIIQNMILIVIIIISIISIAIYFIALNSPLIEPLDQLANKTYEKYENSIFTYEVIRFPTFVDIIDFTDDDLTIGISNDPYNLGFGIIPVGSMGKRVIRVDNNETIPSKVKIMKNGNISSFLEIGEDVFVLGMNETKSVDVQLKTGEDTEIGTYTGVIDLIIVKPKYKGFEFLLGVV